METLGLSIGSASLDYTVTLQSKLYDEAKLDMGGIAKGWAVDQLVAALIGLGYQDCYVDWGADIKVCLHA